ncbi:MAG: UTRA domain-containing protein [Desulfobacterales bacterium]
MCMALSKSPRGDDDLPIQLGLGCVNPAVAPVSAIEHGVEALIPEPWIRKLLQVDESEPCLALRRRTWTQGRAAAYGIFFYPGSRYTPGSRYRPADSETVSLI